MNFTSAPSESISGLPLGAQRGAQGLLHTNVSDEWMQTGTITPIPGTIRAPSAQRAPNVLGMGKGGPLGGRPTMRARTGILSTCPPETADFKGHPQERLLGFSLTAMRPGSLPWVPAPLALRQMPAF